jgi:hypothetical protein
MRRLLDPSSMECQNASHSNEMCGGHGDDGGIFVVGYAKMVFLNPFSLLTLVKPIALRSFTIIFKHDYIYLTSSFGDFVKES